ncbi:MAG TPA: hypothetical protein VGF09_02260 [Solirubrobacterales bacterium]|jgi:hypothetical protein
MSDEIFDQERPRSTMAKRLDEAFAGCEEWTTAPPSRRRSEPDLAPWLAGPSRMIDRAAAARSQEQRAA